MHWLRFSRQGASAFGFMDAGRVRACRGDMFSAWEQTGELIALSEIHWETPCAPTKMIALVDVVIDGVGTLANHYA